MQEVDGHRFNCISERLVIGPLFESDEGHYTVNSTNCFGFQTARMKIIVNSKNQMNTTDVDVNMFCSVGVPTIKPKFQMRSVEHGEDFELPYSVDGDPTFSGTSKDLHTLLPYDQLHPY